jgi:hypothetical protein
MPAEEDYWGTNPETRRIVLRSSAWRAGARDIPMMADSRNKRMLIANPAVLEIFIDFSLLGLDNHLDGV